MLWAAPKLRKVAFSKLGQVWSGRHLLCSVVRWIQLHGACRDWRHLPCRQHKKMLRLACGQSLERQNATTSRNPLRSLQAKAALELRPSLLLSS